MPAVLSGTCKSGPCSSRKYQKVQVKADRVSGAMGAMARPVGPPRTFSVVFGTAT